jgi:hypothetical protein
VTETLAPNIESKYVFALSDKPLLLDYLDAYCLPEGKFKEGGVQSLYYDTLNLDLYEEKRNSDYIKTKIRLRWYTALGEPLARGTRVKCFLELKRKYGAWRRKGRILLDIPADTLLDDPFTDDTLAALPREACELAALSDVALLPAVIVQYSRHRFVDPDTGARISLDTDITCAGANGQLFATPMATPLTTGVLEVKGESRDLPPFLNPLKSLVRKEAFSKYATIVDLLKSPAGVNQ